MKTILKSIVFILLSTVVFANESDEVSKAFANANDLYKNLKPHIEFVKIKHGEFMLFNQNLPHGNIINKSNETRISLNCRFKSLFTPYRQKELGSFFKPLIIRPASRIGLKYKFPEKNCVVCGKTKYNKQIHHNSNHHILQQNHDGSAIVIPARYDACNYDDSIKYIQYTYHMYIYDYYHCYEYDDYYDCYYYDE